MAGLQRLTQVKDKWGDTGRIRKFPVVAAQTYVIGDLLMLSNTSSLQLVTHTGGTASGNIPSGVLIAGVANQGAVGDAGNLLAPGAIAVWEPGLMVAMPLQYVGGTAAQSVFNSNLIGGKYEVNYTNGYPVVDIAHTSNPYVEIVDVFVEDYPGWPNTTGAGTTQYPWVWCQVISSTCALWS